MIRFSSRGISIQWWLPTACLIAGTILLTSCRPALSAEDKQRVTNLAARATTFIARDDEVRVRRKALDAEVNGLLEKERVAAAEAQRASGVKPQSAEQKDEAKAANLRWQEARQQLKTRLKELEPRIAELTAAEEALSIDKAKLQEDARTESQKISPRK